MNCARCNVPFRPGETRRDIYIDGATAGGAVIVVHAYACQRAPQQTAPTRR